MNETKKKIICITISVLLFISIFALGWVLSRHYGNLESSNGNDVRATVRNAQKLNEDSQRELDKAIQYNQRTISANQDAQRTANGIEDSNDELSRLNAEDQNAIERAEQVFDGVDRANQ